MAKFLKQEYGLDNYDRSDRKSSEIHDKINRRARKAMGESAYDHLDFADAVLDILNDYDY